VTATDDDAREAAAWLSAATDEGLLAEVSRRELTATGPADPAPTTTDHDLAEDVAEALWPHLRGYLPMAHSDRIARALLSSGPLADRLSAHGPSKCVTVDDANRVLAQEGASLADRLTAADRDAAALTRVAALHRPWYEVSGVQYEHAVLVPCYEFADCDGDFEHDCPASDGDGHEVPACAECQWTDGDLTGYQRWPCATRRALDGDR
jgi:hypothetical protein